ncbi:MAG: EMC3/TMCO1 family protein [Candidatus Bathyarchaeia archaeon]
MSFPPTTPPGSTIFILIIAASISFLISLANRLTTDPEKTKAWRKEIAEWNDQIRKARINGDKKQMEKLLKKQQYIFQLQAKMSWQSMKVSFLFFIPLMIVWYILSGVYFKQEVPPLAYFPGVGGQLLWFHSLFWWYLLCSLLFSTIFSHLLGISSVE